MWSFGGGPLVSQRSARDVLNRTSLVDPVGLYGSSSNLYGTFSEELPSDCSGDAIAGHIGKFLIHEKRRIRAAFAHKASVQPLLGDSLQLAEEVELWLLARIAPFGVEEPMGEVEHERRGPHIAQMFQTHVHAFADDARIVSDGRTDQIGAEFEDRFVR